MKIIALIAALALIVLAAPASASSIVQDVVRMLPVRCDGKPDRLVSRAARGGVFAGMTCGQAVGQDAIASVYTDAYERILRMPELRATDIDGNPTPRAERLHTIAHLNYCASQFTGFFRLSGVADYRSVGTRVMRLGGCGRL